MESFSHIVPKLEAHLYYFGIRGPRQRGPKLIYRSSRDSFTPPSGPGQDTRVMQLLPVYHHDKLGQDNLWAAIRDEVVKLLDKREIRLTSIDLARFRWEEQNANGGIIPDRLSGDVAFEYSKDILQLLEKHNIHDIDVAYRESVAELLTGPELFAPVNDLHSLKDVIDSVTTTLGLPIAGLKVGETLYGVTARHVLFPEEYGNTPYSYRDSDYTYIAGSKKKVVLMGNKAFDNFLATIQAHIGYLNNTVIVLKKQVVVYMRQMQAGNRQAASDLATTEADMNRKKVVIEELKQFFIKMKEWSKLNDRVIGHVVWAPPIGFSTPPHGYTKDVCVIRLNEKKFLPNFKGNVIDLGPEIEPGKFMSQMNPRNNVQSEFDYPEDRLFRLGAILSATKICEPNNQDHNGDPVRYVIRRGLTTHTTIGRLAGFESHVRRYFVLGNVDSVEVAIYPYNNTSGPFSRGGDSGALIAGSLAEFVALLTGGTGPTDSSDITYGSPMYWLWNDVVKPQFPGAELFFDIPS
ncbi:hypothetical protein EI94DRAFT_1769038 [Lactarius quietus]|nr:hypothetical protein EI94DRAFT_1769038 [Lactarius quietus]